MGDAFVAVLGFSRVRRAEICGDAGPVVAEPAGAVGVMPDVGGCGFDAVSVMAQPGMPSSMLKRRRSPGCDGDTGRGAPEDVS